MVAYYTKAEIDTLLYTNYPSILLTAGISYPKSEIDSTLSDYTTSAQLHTDLYSKIKIHPIFDTYTTTTQLYEGFCSDLYIDNMLLTPTQTGALCYNKTDTDNSLADKISEIGYISLPGMLDIGTSGYTNSRIRCNAKLNGYTGYAELRADSSYGMFLNLSTTRTDGGWMYFQMNNGRYIQLPRSDNKVDIYKDTTIPSSLTVNGDLDSSKKFPLDIKNSTINTEFWALASFHQGIANSGS